MVKARFQGALHLACGCAALFLFIALPLRSAPSFTQILGQPTDRSITVAVRADSPLEFYFQYGLAPSSYSLQTSTALLTADPNAPGSYVSQTVLGGLAPDTRYFYRLQYRAAGSSGTFVAAAENTFHTQRARGGAFVFCIQGDSHPERERSMFNSALYTQTLTAAAKEQPDFYITSGDNFSVDTLPTPYTQAAVAGRYSLQLPWLDAVARSAPLFLVTGNHEQTSLWNYNLPADSNNSNMVAVWAQNARNLYYPMPAPGDANSGSFYSGNTVNVPGIGLLRDYYAWEWGDALFVVIDPYWASPVQIDNTLGGDKADNGKPADRWLVTHGDQQYNWLKQTLEQSKAKWKFVFAHHVLGTGRGAIEVATLYEWGGNNANGGWGFSARRPSWPATIHELMVQNHVTIFFQAHDHLFAHQQLDGVTYQSLPNPADFTYTAFNADAYKSGDILPNSGYVRVAVSPDSVKVDYIREYLPQDESAMQHSGEVAFSYTIGSTAPPRRRAVAR